MIDFHSHILPGMDDGASCPEESVEMMRLSAEQGVDVMVATSHFYPDEEEPSSFLKRRQTSLDCLVRYCTEKKIEETLPQVILGAEVYYFPGIGTCDEIESLTIDNTPYLLVEPPMVPFSRNMVDEIEAIGRNFNIIPVIAHLDRYCRMLHSDFLFDLISSRQILIQVNASFFIHRDMSRFALDLLRENKIHFIGSDCHNTEERAPNIGCAKDIISSHNLNKNLERINRMLSID